MISLMPKEQEGFNAILVDLERLLTRQGCEIPPLQTYDRLVNKSDFWVGRLAFETASPTHPAQPPTVIVKHVPPEHYPPHITRVPSQLREELLVYRFLEMLRPGFDRFPGLLGHNPGLLVLEDLQTIEQAAVSAADDLRQVADTLARLHAASAGQRTHYNRLRSEIGLPDYAEVGYPSQEEWFGFLEGLNIWHSWAVFFGLPAVNWRELAEQVRRVLFSPGLFLSLIHTELASPRNAVRTRRGVCLIDFERARFGHALLDVAIAMIGHIEWHKVKEGYFLRHLDAAMDFADAYRQDWEMLAGKTVPHDHWQDALAAALVFTAGLATGAGQRAEARYPAARPLSQILLGIMRRLSQNLVLLNRFSTLVLTLQKLAENFHVNGFSE